jgi:3'(2'), 5'-bisphosphate nucleotidase
MNAATTVPELQPLVPPLLDLCRRAGELICRYYAQPEGHLLRAKSDDSPLTQADLDSHHLLQRELAQLAPGIPVLSEESAGAEVEGRREWPVLWLIDPLDGTREFVERTGEFTINIALISRQRPVLGVLYVPLENTAWVGIPGVESRRYEWEKTGAWRATDTAVRPLRRTTGLTVLASRRHRGERLGRCLDWLEQQWGGPCSRRNSGSALKFCQLVEGQGDFYPRFSPCCEWDTAAGQAVLEAAGGALLGMDGRPLRYNARETLLSPPFYGLAEPGHPLWQRLLHAR